MYSLEHLYILYTLLVLWCIKLLEMIVLSRVAGVGVSLLGRRKEDVLLGERERDDEKGALNHGLRGLKHGS